ncbi:tripartite tricarboxylate transporter TctB family protein [Schaalia sp. ZJ405]|uniref:tripartite tricarboxylate transporter TctB family protein n=1 Tax=Schaalia sp. ZJ405 TaxID=2709403 RepID=UPI0013E9AFF4|nr:tripartite tricarboxylate transporter TctB family protein [Schaalia sp. ZJ405]QPK81638.1 tripartite tricarboxylate transporter TctB family protein [Schaalia sp. ZJ405]
MKDQSRLITVIKKGALDIFLALAFVVLTVLIAIDAHGYKAGVGNEPGPAAVPTVLSVLLLLVAGGMLIQVFRGKWEDQNEPDAIRNWRVLGGIVLLILVGILMPLIGFFVTFSIVLFGLSLLSGTTAWWKSAIFSLIVTWVVLLLFSRYLNVPLPASPVDLMLGA